VQFARELAVEQCPIARKIRPTGQRHEANDCLAGRVLIELIFRMP
jgi:hypothetical protein